MPPNTDPDAISAQIKKGGFDVLEDEWDKFLLKSFQPGEDDDVDEEEEERDNEDEKAAAGAGDEEEEDVEEEPTEEEQNNYENSVESPRDTAQETFVDDVTISAQIASLSSSSNQPSVEQPVAVAVDYLSRRACQRHCWLLQPLFVLRMTPLLLLLTAPDSADAFAAPHWTGAKTRTFPPQPTCAKTARGGPGKTHLQHRWGLAAETSSKSDDEKSPSSSSALVLTSSTALRRTQWLSWWAQVILTTVSAVTLLFAKSVVNGASSTSRQMSNNAGGLFFAGTGILTSCLSIFWTWGGARLSRRWRRQTTSDLAAASMLRRAISVGVSLNCIGMFLTLLGAQQIIGGLAVKVLSNQGVLVSAGTTPVLQTLQPLDILVVQANTNTLMSHFASLLGLLYLTKYVGKLDPPSTEAKPRRRKE